MPNRRSFIALVAAATALPSLLESEYQNQFVDFINRFDKVYSANEFFTRYNTYKYWVDFVREHNSGNSTWTAGINQFSDLTPEQFAATYLSGLPAGSTSRVPSIVIGNDESSDDEPSNDVDWRSKGAVSPAKNQGQCGACWAFSATGAIEGWWVARRNQSLVSLSEQQLVDCTHSSGCQGCNGGWPDKAIGYISHTSTGSCTESVYPYIARDGTCKQCQGTVKPGGVELSSGEPTLAKILDFEPVSVCLDASGIMSYHGGIFRGPCGTTLNHATLAVGYTAEYWIVKNSWGQSWGQSGYIYIERGRNLCGIGNHISWVTPL